MAYLVVYLSIMHGAESWVRILPISFIFDMGILMMIIILRLLIIITFSLSRMVHVRLHFRKDQTAMMK